MAFTDPGPGPGAAATVGGMALGCLFFIVLMFPVIVGASLGDCDPQPCPVNHMVRNSALLLLGPALLLAVGLRSLFHWLGGKIRAQEPGAAAYTGPTPWWSFAAVPPAIWTGWYLVWGYA